MNNNQECIIHIKTLVHINMYHCSQSAIQGQRPNINDLILAFQFTQITFIYCIYIFIRFPCLIMDKKLKLAVQILNENKFNP